MLRTSKPAGVQTKANKTGYPISRAAGQERHAGDPDFQIVTKAIDHPFHIHINPFYLLRIEVPGENGNLVNILDEPRWQDAIWLPRNGGRVTFRSRFADFIGQYELPFKSIATVAKNPRWRHNESKGKNEEP